MKQRGRRVNGFTLIELLLVLAIIVIVSGFVILNLPAQVARWQIVTSAQQVASVFQRARLEAVRRNEEGRVRIVDNRAVAAFGTSLTFDAVLRGGVVFAAPSGETTVDGFGDDDEAIFRVDGTVAESGAFRLAGARNHFLEVRIDPPATARTVLRKWDPVASEFKAQGEGGQQWQW